MGIPRPTPWWRGWGPILVLPAGVVAFAPDDWPPWLVMWVLAVAIFAGCKWLTWRRTPAPAAPFGRHIGYLLAWPGLDAPAFLTGVPRPQPRASEWLFALVKFGLGAALLWLLIPLVSAQASLLRGWVGMLGLIFLLHFGSFHLLSCCWRAAGVDAKPLMEWPVRASSLSEFWGRRWNTAFRDFTYRFLFKPLTAQLGPRWGLAAGFLFSGLIHEVVISWPAGGGWGGPTAYFANQGFGLVVERSRFARRLGPRPRLAGVGVYDARCGRAGVLAFPPAFYHERGQPVPRCADGKGGAMSEWLPDLIRVAGAGQLGVLVASSLVPLRLDWKRELAGLSRLHRQMYWVYGGYVVLSIVAFGVISLVNAEELAGGGWLARSFCLYVAVFWGIRLCLQPIFDVKKHLTTWWLTAGYHLLSVLFLFFTVIYGLIAFRAFVR